jgi:hypothetical protein
MTPNRTAAIALIAGTAAGLTTMALHPTGKDLVENAASGGHNVLNTAVHGLAIVGQGLILAGALAVSTRLRARRDLAAGAYVFYSLATMAIVIAAGASGFIAPSVVQGYARGLEAERQAMIGALNYTGLINQAFARIAVICTAVALVLWSSAILAGRELSRALGWFGVSAGALLGLGIISGHLSLGIHGFGFVVLVQGVFLVWIAAQLWSADDGASVSQREGSA